MKKRLIFPLFAALLFVSCSTKDKAALSVNIVEPSDSSALCFSKLSINRIIPLDTVSVKNGRVKYNLSVGEGAPEFIYLSLNGSVPVSLLVSAGEKMEIELRNDGSLISLSGSAESSRMQEVERGIRDFNRRFDSVTVCLAKAVSDKDKIAEKRLTAELGRMLVCRKRESIDQIYKNPASMTALPLFYQKTSTGLPIFSQSTDAIFFERIYDSLSSKYSASPYLASLSDEIAARKNILEMENKMRWAEKEDFPEITLSDINGRRQSLSSYKGKLIALVFWDAGDVNQRMYNAELKRIYEKYREKGFEIFQVALAANKTGWALQVKEQKIPWVSVCDPAGASSPAAISYNVKQLPAMFLISKDAEIVAKDLFEINKLESEIRRRL